MGKETLKDVYTKEIVRKAALRDGKSKRQIARELGIHRNTITRLLKLESKEAPEFQRKQWSHPVLGPHIATIESWLKEDEKAPRKQRHTATRIYNRLREEYGFTGGKRTVQEYVSRARKKQPEVFLPLVFNPGEMAQVDWAEVKANIAGRFCKLQLFALVLNHSGATYYQAFERANQESFFEGHCQAFLFFGGVPCTITYDNLKSAVKKILRGRNREENERFAAFRSGWLFDSRFCNPARGNEKGRVENMIKYAERNYFAPVPHFDSLDQLNAWLRKQCLKYQGIIQARQTQTVGERLKAEQEYLLPLPQYPPECCRILSLKADKSSLVQFETNRYSVPVEYAHTTVWLKAFVERVEITNQETLIATHSRLKGRFEESILAAHYRKVLERKPGAVVHLRAVEKECPPEGFGKTSPSVYPKVTVQAPDLTVYRQLRKSQNEPTPSHDAGNPSEKTAPAEYRQTLPEIGVTSRAR